MIIAPARTWDGDEMTDAPYLPVFEFLQGDGEDFRVAYQMTYAGDAAFFDGQYKLSLAAEDGTGGIAFSSDVGAENLIQIDKFSDTPSSGMTTVTFSFKAPWLSFYGKSGIRVGNLQIKNDSGIFDLAMVSGEVKKRPTYSEPLPQ